MFKVHSGQDDIVSLVIWTDEADRAFENADSGFNNFWRLSRQEAARLYGRDTVRSAVRAMRNYRKLGIHKGNWGRCFIDVPFWPGERAVWDEEGKVSYEDYED